MPSSWPSYVGLLESGELARRAREAVGALADCTACPRQCHADRRRDDSPQSCCRTGRLAPREFREAAAIAREAGLRLARG
jgi:putative pyruvate formate lyase activating enzyme